MPGTPPKYSLPVGSCKNYKESKTPDSILKIQPWQKLMMNPDAGIYPYEYTPKFSNYGFLEKSEEENNLIKNYSKAIVQANLAIELNPSQPAPLLTLGIIYSKMNEHQRAYVYFKEAAGKGLDSVDLFNNWAVSSYNLGTTDQSIRLLKHALVLNPEHPESHYNLGIAYSSKGMLKEAQREMALAMQLRNKSKK